MIPAPGVTGPPSALPLAGVFGGALALLAAGVALLLRPSVLVGYHGSGPFLALTHTFTLGFVTLVFVGTLQQLLPVLLVTDLALPRLGYLTQPMLALGALGVVLGFALGFRPVLLAAGATLVVVALWLAMLQAYLSARRSPKRDAAAKGLVVSTLYLAIAVTLGLLLAGSRQQAWLAQLVGYPVRLHLAVGLAGAFLLGIATAGQRLLAMFALAKKLRTWRLRTITALVHAGLATELLAVVSALPLGWLAWSLIAAASAVQLLEVAALLKVRLRKRLEAPIQRYLVAHAFLPLAGVLALLGHPAPAAVAMLLGFVGIAVSGMLVKIASFLAWLARSRSASGAPALLKELMWPELERPTTVALTLGTLAVIGAMLWRSVPFATAAAWLLTFGALLQAVQVGHILFAPVAAAAAPSKPAPVAAAAPSEPTQGASSPVAASTSSGTHPPPATPAPERITRR